MEETTRLLESLLDSATDYGKTSFELVKLKTIEKTTDIVSSLIPHSVVIILIGSFLLFLNLGLALWLGEILGKAFYGFFAVAGFYIFAGVIIHFFMHNRIKMYISNYLVKQAFK
jgi:hypothetical protein